MMLETFEQYVANVPADIAKHPRDALWNYYQQGFERFVSGLQADLANSLAMSEIQARRHVTDIVARAVVEAHFGAIWTATNFDVTPVGRQAAGYFYSAAEADALRVLTVHRQREFARRIHQLQSFEWFPLLRNHARTTALSGAAFELDVTVFLMHLPLAVERVAATGVKGLDYDLRYLISDPPLAVEAKAKDDATPFCESSIRATVKTAIKQMPKGRAGFLFIRLPPRWVSRELEQQYHLFLAEAVRQTSRIAVVFTAVDKVLLNRPGARARVERQWDYFRTTNCSDEKWKLAMWLKSFHDGDFDMAAPGSPF